MKEQRVLEYLTSTNSLNPVGKYLEILMSWIKIKDRITVDESFLQTFGKIIATTYFTFEMLSETSSRRIGSRNFSSFFNREF